MSALIDAIKKDQAESALELLKDENIRSIAAMNNNEALFLAASKGHLLVVIELLKIKAVFDNAAARDNAALRFAARNGHLSVVIELLKIKAVFDNGAARDNEALYLAASKGHLLVVIELLKIKAVSEDAVARDNEALRLAAEQGHLSVVIELLKIKAVFDNAAVRNNEALRFAASNGHLLVVIELLKIKAVSKNPAAQNNEALREAASNGHLSVVTELLKLESVKKRLEASDHKILRILLHDVDRFGIANLVYGIYQQKGVQLPQDLISKFEDFSRGLTEQNKSEKCMIAVVEAIFKSDATAVLDLLKDEKVKNIAEMGNNLALNFAINNGCVELVRELLQIGNVRAAIHDSRMLCLAIERAYPEIVAALLKIIEVQSQALDNDNQALGLAMQFKAWPIAVELLKLGSVQSALTKNHIQEVLSIAIAADQLGIVLSIIDICRGRKLSLPEGLAFPFGESFEPLPTLRERLEEVQKGAVEFLGERGWSPALTWTVFRYADILPLSKANIAPQKSNLMF